MDVLILEANEALLGDLDWLKKVLFGEDVARD